MYVLIALVCGAFIEGLYTRPPTSDTAASKLGREDVPRSQLAVRVAVGAGYTGGLGGALLKLGELACVSEVREVATDEV